MSFEIGFANCTKFDLEYGFISPLAEQGVNLSVAL